ncbi:MAG: PorP/SprF family type IX secretion system membrane protein [Bacteroidota bacterium]
MRLIITTLGLLFFAQLSVGQDIHWSQFNDNPLFQNPANAGHFNGDYRFVGNLRDQWRAVTKPFTTFSLSADSKWNKQPQLGYGLLFFHDVSGDGKLRTIEVQGNVAYQLKLSADSTHNLRFGLNVGMNHRQVNWNNFYFDNQFNGQQFDPNLPTNELYQNDRKTNFSVGTGISYEFRINERKKINAGVGLHNLNRPNQGFFNTTIRRDIRFSAFAKGIYKLDIDWDIVPSLQFNVQGVYREFVVGTQAKYYFTNTTKKYVAFYGGFFYRNRDAMFISVGMDYNNWFAGISYDINYSKLVPASYARGGMEFAVRYILHHFRPSKAIHRVCPDYI